MLIHATTTISNATSIPAQAGKIGKAITSDVQGIVGRVLSFSLDTFIYVGAIAAIFGFFLYIGRAKSLATLLALYVAGFVLLNFTYLEKIMGTMKDPKTGAIVKLLIFSVLFVLARYFLRDNISGSYAYGSIFKIAEALVLAIGFVSFVFIYAFKYFSVDLFYTFSPFFVKMLSMPSGIFWVTISPLILLYFLGRR